MPRANEQEFLKDVLKGNTSAIQFCQLIFRTSQVLDDLVDRDRPVTSKRVIEAFWEILIDLPKNQFYQQHTAELVPMMQIYLQDWIDATSLERGTEHEKHIAFVLRDTLGGIIIQVAHMAFGFEWAQRWAPSVRRHIHEDTLEDYIKGLNT